MKQGYVMSVSGTVGNIWQDQLNAYNAQTGTYWVPDPPFGATLAQLKAAANKVQLFIDEFENLFTYIFKSEYTNPMHNLQNQLKQKKYLYDLAIAEMEKAPLPEPGTGTRPDDTDVIIPDDTAGEKSNTMLYVAGAGLIALALYARKKSRKKVSGAGSIVPIALVAGGIALAISNTKFSNQ